MSEEDKVVHLLANLPKLHNTLVTALEACPEVPKMDVVTEKLLYEESKQSRICIKDSEEALLTHHMCSPTKLSFLAQDWLETVLQEQKMRRNGKNLLERIRSTKQIK